MAQRTHAYRGFATGQFTSVATATQLPDIPCKEVVLRPEVDVHYGPDDTVTASTGFPLAGAEHSPPIYVGNLNQIWAIGAGTLAFQVHV